MSAATMAPALGVPNFGYIGLQETADYAYGAVINSSVLIALCCVLNNLSDFRWPPKYLRSRERHENHGWKSWVQSVLAKVQQRGGEVNCQLKRSRKRSP